MSKTKGSKSERELIHIFYDAGWAPLRVAGSGSTQLPAADIIAGKDGRVLAVECKSSGKEKIYIDKDQIRELALFAQTFGAEAVVAVRFNREAWRFLTIAQLRDSGHSFVVDKQRALTVGKTFPELSRDSKEEITVK